MTDVPGRIIAMQNLCKLRLNYPLSDSPSSNLPSLCPLSLQLSTLFLPPSSHLLFGDGSHYVALASLEFLGSSDPPTSVMHHHASLFANHCLSLGSPPFSASSAVLSSSFLRW